MLLQPPPLPLLLPLQAPAHPPLQSLRSGSRWLPRRLEQKVQFGDVEGVVKQIGALPCSSHSLSSVTSGATHAHSLCRGGLRCTGMFHTTLEGEDGSVIFVPNGSITGGVITNKTTPPCVRTVRTATTCLPETRQ